MSSIIPFYFGSAEVRIVDKDGYVWVVLKDVLSAAKTSTRPSDAVESIKQALGEGVVFDYPLQTSGGIQRVTIIREEAVTYLLAQSRTDDGRKLNRFIHLEVLPSIRKTGKYEVSAPAPTTAIPASAEFHALFNVARLIGLDTNAAAISANQGVIQLTGTNVLALLGQTHLPAEQQVLWFTPTELGKTMDVSARQLNLLLAEAGFQHNEDGKWIPSAKADGLFRIFDTGKKHNSGIPVQQVKWSKDVLDHIKPLPLVA